MECWNIGLRKKDFYFRTSHFFHKICQDTSAALRGVLDLDFELNISPLKKDSQWRRIL